MSASIPIQGSLQGTVALVTGANRGIGYEIARGLGLYGITVAVGSRDESRGRKAVDRLAEDNIDAHVLHIDITDQGSIALAAKVIESRFGRLDILVNNAGISVESGMMPSKVDLDVLRRIYEVNVFGAVAVIQQMLPLIRKSSRGRIVNISSKLGSLALLSDPRHGSAAPLLLAYNSSKSALNAITVQFANELRETSIKVNAACPGYCATDLTNNTGNRSARAGAVTPIRLACLPDDGPTGCFFNDHGVLPW